MKKIKKSPTETFTFIKLIRGNRYTLTKGLLMNPHWSTVEKSQPPTLFQEDEHTKKEYRDKVRVASPGDEVTWLGVQEYDIERWSNSLKKHVPSTQFFDLIEVNGKRYTMYHTEGNGSGDLKASVA